MTRKLQFLYSLDISYNHLDEIDKEMLKAEYRLNFLFATSSRIAKIEDFAFQKQTVLYYLFLDGNKLTRVTKEMFTGPKYLFFLSLTNNPLNAIEKGSFKQMKNLEAIYLINTYLHTLGMGSVFSAARLNIVFSSKEVQMGVICINQFRPFLESSGYTCVLYDRPFYQCIPCDQGLYKTNVFGESESGCQKCPPGGFYQDEIAHVGEIVYGLGCKQCPAGSYVNPDNAPGKTMESCTACLEGTNLKQLAGFRACPCLDDHYRLDRFGKCIECPIGYHCTNETIDLLPGFYWIWKDEEQKQNYITFSIKLQEEHKDLSNSWRTYNGSIPQAYFCPFIGSCKGGMDAECSDGYEGPLCAICSKGYYRMFSGCNKCPSLYLFVGQCFAIAVVAAVLVFAIVRDKKSNHANRRSVSDTIFSTFKIVIGFYQVTSGTLNAYSYIKWPEALTKLMKFADVVQLNIFKLVPVECLKQSVRLTPFAGLLVYVCLDAMVIVVAFLYYFVKKACTNGNKNGGKRKISKCKSNCYRAVFLFLFITYPATCEKVFQVLPSSCHQVCDNQQDCSWFLQSDYSVTCYTSFYNRFAILAYFALLIPIGFPLITIFLLWKYCRSNGTNDIDEEGTNEVTKEEKTESQGPIGHEISVGMRFIYENYSEDCWYWEVIELIRKVIFTSVLVYSGQDGRLFLGVTAIMSGFYAVYFAHAQPIPHVFDKWLHLGSLLATMANQFMAMLLRIPAEAVSTLVNEEDDSLGITLFLVFANIFVVVIIAARYLYGVYLSLKVIKENPRCDLTCVLSVLQVVNFGAGNALSVEK